MHPQIPEIEVVQSQIEAGQSDNREMMMLSSVISD